MKKLTITIDRIGKPKVEADGFNGVGCMTASKHILDAFNDKDSARMTEEKPEIHMISCGEETMFEQENF
jgi:hypothetical protein